MHALVAKLGWACRSIRIVEGKHFSAVYTLGGGLSVHDLPSYFSFFFSMAVLLFMIHDKLRYLYSKGCVKSCDRFRGEQRMDIIVSNIRCL